jgi:hypothetical protein
LRAFIACDCGFENPVHKQVNEAARLAFAFFAKGATWFGNRKAGGNEKAVGACRSDRRETEGGRAYSRRAR